MSLRFEEADENEQWAPVSDLMAALMLIFMFLMLAIFGTATAEKEAHAETCDRLYRVLEAEFDSDFKEWNVELMEDLTIRFRDPEVLFKSQESKILPRFEAMLRKFFPRYMNIVRSDEHAQDIREIRIEGHTSSVWGNLRADDAYFKNMELSQERTREILRFVLQLPEAPQYADWAREKITANGLSSSQLVRDKTTKKEIPALSRRVEFRLLASSCQKAGRDNREKGREL